MGRRRERREAHRQGYEPPPTARQAAMLRQQLFVEEFRALFGEEWTRTLWRAVDRRLADPS